jgi:hypothetical protein
MQARLVASRLVIALLPFSALTCVVIQGHHNPETPKEQETASVAPTPTDVTVGGDT